jgi:hypothetical protein
MALYENTRLARPHRIGPKAFAGIRTHFINRRVHEGFAPESTLDRVVLLANRHLLAASHALPAPILARTRALLLMK